MVTKNTKRKNRSPKKPILQKLKEGVDSKLVDTKKGVKISSGRFKKFWKFLVDKNKDKAVVIKQFFLIVAGYGLIINYALHFLWDINFTIFTLFAWGITYYFINDEFVEWFRRLIAKR